MVRIKVDGILFDFGNTLLLDPFDKVLKLKSYEFQTLLKSFGYDISKDDIIKSWTYANKKVNYPYIAHFYQELPILKYCLDLLKVETKDKNRIATQLLIAYRDGLKRVVQNDSRKEEITNTLKELKTRGKRLMVFSNDRGYSAQTILGWLGIKKYFHKIITSERIRMEKPDLKAFEYVLNILGTRREKTVYVGDYPKHDVEPTKKLGMKAILYIHPKMISMPWRDYKIKLNKKCKPDATIHKFSELTQILI